MRVLMPATTVPAARALADELTAAGHTVHRCHDDADRGLGCSVLRGRQCPVEEFPVDIAVDVREQAGSPQSPLEDGVVCAIRMRLPVIVAGETAGDPFRPWVTEVPGPIAVADVAAIAARPLPQHSQLASAALREFLGEVATGADHVEVYRQGGSLTAVVSVPGGIDRGSRDMAAVRVVKAIREWDRFTSVVDVTFARER